MSALSKHRAQSTRRPLTARRAGRPVVVVLASLSAMAVLTGSSAFAATGEDTGDVSVVNTETVQAYLGPDGSVSEERVYEQLSLTGTGRVNLDNPVETAGLRNLDGFGSIDADAGTQASTLEVDGVSRFRTVSDYTGDLPLEISISYTLDGESVEADDVVGRSGLLGVEYTVRNVTAEPREVSYPDGKGGEITETVDVVVPMVGSLTTTAPAGFTDVRSEAANIAGDGKGGTKLSFTMTLFEPVASNTATFGYSAQVVDAVVPEAAITALPVNPLEVPTFATAAASYQGGSETGIKLTEGATEIDENLLLLRDGAAKLLSGLIQLSDGAEQLDAGLSGKAAPGAARLADGASELAGGLRRLDDGAGLLGAGTQRLDSGAGALDAGAGRLDAGAGELSAGAGDLASGAGRLSAGTGDALAGGQKLTSGLQQISGGLGQLADAQSGLPSAVAGIDALQAGVDKIVAGFGATGQTGTLLDGLGRLEAGAGSLLDGSTLIQGGLSQLRGDGSAATPGLVGAKGGVDRVQAGLEAAVGAGGSLDQLVGALQSVQGGADCTASCPPTLAAIIERVRGNKAALAEGNVGLQQVSAGLGQAIGALDTRLVPGAAALVAGAQQLRDGATAASAGAGKLRAGAAEVRAGLDQLEAGVVNAVSGVLELSAGADSAAAGSGDLVDGLGRLDAGAGDLADGSERLSAGAGTLKAGTGDLVAGTGELASGAGELASGAGELAAGAGDAADGSDLLAAGAGELSAGLGDAADGSSRLAAGLAEAEAAAPALPDGAQRLSDEGMSKLLDAGKATAQDYGKLYAVLAAGGERGETEAMAYGAPEGATGLTAYSLTIEGADAEGERNWTRGLGGLALLGAGLGAFGLRRRFSI